jgi:hypothetical protein
MTGAKEKINIDLESLEFNMFLGCKTTFKNSYIVKNVKIVKLYLTNWPPISREKQGIYWVKDCHTVPYTDPYYRSVVPKSSSVSRN